MFKNTLSGGVLVICLVALCTWTLLVKEFKLGIDLEGGTRISYRVDVLSTATKEQIAAMDNPAESTKAIVANRLQQGNFGDIPITVVGSNNLVIEIPGGNNSLIKPIIQKIEQTGNLSFHLLASSTQQSDESIAKIESDWAAYNASLSDENIPDLAEPNFLVIQLKNNSLPTAEEGDDETAAEENEENVTYSKVVVEYSAGKYVKGEFLNRAFPTRDESGLPCLGFEFDTNGATQFRAMTGANKNRMLVINLDGIEISRATINDEIGASGIIKGIDAEEIAPLVTILNGGSIPTELVQISRATTGSTLGQASIDAGQHSILAGLILVLIFMVLYYSIGGMVANAALLLNLLLLSACVVLFNNTLTLAGMAGLLLTVGMAVDANILIFERVREEKSKGRSLNQALGLGYQRAFWTIFDANLTTFITGFILYKFGSPGVKSFAIILMIGLVASFFCSVYFSRLVLSMLLKAGILKEFKMGQVLHNPNFDFFGVQKMLTTVSVSIIVIGMLVFMARGRDTMGLDFTGGSEVIVSLNEHVSEKDFTDTVKSFEGFEKAIPQSFGDAKDGKFDSFVIRIASADNSEALGQGEKRFELAISEGLKAKGLLAPDGITPVANPAAGSVGVVVQLGGADGLTPEAIQNAVNESPDFSEAKAVAKADLTTGSIYSAYEVTAKTTQSQTMAEAKLGELLLSSFTVSDSIGSVQSIGGSVAQDFQGKVFVAILLAFVAIVFYISLRFEFKFGLAAVTALLHDILFTIGVIAMADAVLGSLFDLKISLTVIAAFLTVVGYSLNDTIVIFDRIRENLIGTKRDVDFKAIVHKSVNQTLSRTILTSITTFVATLILFIWGGPALKGFSFALSIGVVVGTFSSIYVASPALMYFHKKGLERREAILAEEAAAQS